MLGKIIRVGPAGSPFLPQSPERSPPTREHPSGYPDGGSTTGEGCGRERVRPPGRWFGTTGSCPILKGVSGRPKRMSVTVTTLLLVPARLSKFLYSHQTSWVPGSRGSGADSRRSSHFLTPLLARRHLSVLQCRTNEEVYVGVGRVVLPSPEPKGNEIGPTVCESSTFIVGESPRGDTSVFRSVHVDPRGGSQSAPSPVPPPVRPERRPPDPFIR